MNDYERAAERFENISRNYKTITDAAMTVIEWAGTEYEAASANLAKYETSPGIPLPEYRESSLAREV